MRKQFVGFSVIPALIAGCVFLFVSVACSKDDDHVRTPADIVGVWSTSSSYYLEFNDDNTARLLEISEQDGETIGTWSEDVYLYEPGYNLVVYLDYPNDISVYQIVSLSSTEFVWCWVKDIREQYEAGESIGNIIGQIINEAQDGFTLNPELYQTFYKVPEDKFLEILESLNIVYPW